MAAETTYPSSRSAPERVALVLVLLALIGLPLAVLGYRALDRTRGPLRVIELTGRLPTADQGGWTPETIAIEKGERVLLRLTSADVVHGFAVPKLGIDVGWVEPGKVKEIELVADRPGRYTFLCTVWCLDSHWRMRGTLEVTDPDDPAASARDVDPPQTDWVAAGLDIDADHPGAHWPETQPDAASGADVLRGLGAAAAEALAGLDTRQLSPSDAYARLAELDDPAAAALAPKERWDAVAGLWYRATTPEALATGRQLYERDCAGCHGLEGRGDGPGALAAPGGDGQVLAATDFTNRAAQVGAQDLLYYGKLVRGGAGTSMPYYGTVYVEDELWAIIDHLRGFAFRFPDATD